MDSSQEIIVREPDCGTEDYIVLTKDESEIRGEPLFDLIFGRVVADDVRDNEGHVLVQKGELLDRHHTNMILERGVESIKVKSPMTCHTISGVCQQCFGMDLSTRNLIEIGTPIGVISSQSIGEPGTQLTMRTFHS